MPDKYRVIYSVNSGSPILAVYFSRESCKKDFEDHKERKLIHPRSLDASGLGINEAEDLFGELSTRIPEKREKK